MSIDEPFDPSVYTRAPILSIGSAITLAGALRDAASKTPTSEVKKAITRLTAAADAAEQAWMERKRQMGVVSDEDSRLVDQLGDNVWSALRSRVQAYTLLPHDMFPKAARAAEILVIVFGDEGLSFLKETYAVQLATMNATLKRIDTDGLAQELDDLAGPDFLKAIRAVMPRYDAMVQAMLSRDEATGVSLAEQVRAIQRAVVSYATRVCAQVDEEDAASVAAARAMLRPIIALREAAAARRSPGPEAAAPKAGEDAPA